MINIIPSRDSLEIEALPPYGKIGFYTFDLLFYAPESLDCANSRRDTQCICPPLAAPSLPRWKMKSTRDNGYDRPDTRDPETFLQRVQLNWAADGSSD